MTEAWHWLIKNGRGEGDMSIISVSTNERGMAFNSVAACPSERGVALVKEVWPM